MNGYFFFFLVVFFAFFAFFAFLAMLPSVTPKLAQCKSTSTCIGSEYTTIAKLILRASKRVNGRHACCDLRPERSSRVRRGYVAPCWSEEGKSSHVVGRRSRRGDVCRKRARAVADDKTQSVWLVLEMS